MARPDDTLLMNEGDGVFPSTQWTLILDGRGQNEVVERLYTLYWRPLYTLLRRKGFGNDDAKEYTQDFLMDILLNRQFIQVVDRTRGSRFRSLLVKSFLNFVNGKLRKKRECSFDVAGCIPCEIPAGDTEETIRAFDYEWALAVLQHALDDVKTQCRENGLDTHWCVFRDRIVTPILQAKRPPTLSEIGQRYKIEPLAKVSNMIVTVKRRFQASLTHTLGRPASQAQAGSQELADLFAILSRSQ